MCAVREKFKTQWLELISEGGQAVVIDTDFGSDAQPRLLRPDGVLVARHPLGWALRRPGAESSAALLAPGHSGGFTMAPVVGNASQFNKYGAPATVSGRGKLLQ